MANVSIGKTGAAFVSWMNSLWDSLAFTSADHTKLDGIATGATKNVIYGPYTSPTQAEADGTLATGELYYLDGSVPGTWAGMIFKKLT